MPTRDLRRDIADVRSQDLRPGRVVKEELRALGVEKYQDAPLIQQVDIMRKVLKTHSRCLLPHSRWVERWDLVMIFLLIFVSVVTPFEVGFVTGGMHMLFYVNCVIDLFFVADMLMQFYLAFEEEGQAAVRLVTDLRRIRMRYLRGWFIIDFISIIPFDAISQVMVVMDRQDKPERESSGPFSSQMRVVRLIRVARLLKLARLFRCSRIYARVSAKIDVLFIKLEVVKWSFCLVFMSHLFACMMALLGDISASEFGSSWYCAAVENKGRECENNMWYEYSLALYWSVMTITSIGYGDIVPMTHLEVIGVTIMMLSGSFLWAHIVGSFCAVVSALDTEKMAYQQRMDSVLTMSKDRFLPRDLRVRLRHFFQQSRRMHRMSSQGQIMSFLSPALQGEVALAVTLKYLQKMSWLTNAEHVFLQTLAKSLELHFFSPREIILPGEFGQQGAAGEDVQHSAGRRGRYSRRPVNVGAEASPGEITRRPALTQVKNAAPPLTIMERGIAARGIVLSAGSVWHDDSILIRVPSLRDPLKASSLTFCSVYTITRSDFLATLDSGNYPQAAHHLRRASFIMTFMRAVIHAAQIAKARAPNLRNASTPSKDSLPKLRRVDEKLVDVILEILGKPELDIAGHKTYDEVDAFAEFQRPGSRQRTLTRDFSKMGSSESLYFDTSQAHLNPRLNAIEKSLCQTTSELAQIRTILAQIAGTTGALGPGLTPALDQGRAPTSECWAPDHWSVREPESQDDVDTR